MNYLDNSPIKYGPSGNCRVCGAPTYGRCLAHGNSDEQTKAIIAKLKADRIRITEENQEQMLVTINKTISGTVDAYNSVTVGCTEISCDAIASYEWWRAHHGKNIEIEISIKVKS